MLDEQRGPQGCLFRIFNIKNLPNAKRQGEEVRIIAVPVLQQLC